MPERLADGITPLSCVTDNELSKLLALLATKAYGVGVNGCGGSNTAKPCAPSLNHMRNFRFGSVNKPGANAVMFGTDASPNAIVKRPLLTGTLTAAAGS